MNGLYSVSTLWLFHVYIIYIINYLMNVYFFFNFVLAVDNGLYFCC